MAEPVTAILRRALRLIDEEHPRASESIASALRGLSVSVAIANEPAMTLAVVNGALVETDSADPAAIRVRTDRATVRRLLAGGQTLTQSLRRGAVELSGTTKSLMRGLHAFEHFVGALLRSNEADDLRRELECEA